MKIMCMRVSSKTKRKFELLALILKLTKNELLTELIEYYTKDTNFKKLVEKEI